MSDTPDTPISERIRQATRTTTPGRCQATEIDRLTTANDELHEDVIQALRIRTRALHHLAEELAPGPDGQDYIDRERAIDAAIDRAHEDEIDGEPPPHRMTASRDTLLAEIDRLTAALAEAELAAEQVLADRDRCEEWADALAYAIAPIEQIGEHSSLNSPWENAIAALADRDATIAELREALDWHIDESPCRFDHNGHCQEHYDFAMRPGDICGMERSRRLLAEETP